MGRSCSLSIILGVFALRIIKVWGLGYPDVWGQPGLERDSLTGSGVSGFWISSLNSWICMGRKPGPVYSSPTSLTSGSSPSPWVGDFFSPPFSSSGPLSHKGPFNTFWTAAFWLVAFYFDTNLSVTSRTMCLHSLECDGWLWGILSYLVPRGPLLGTPQCPMYIPLLPKPGLD